VPPLHIDIFVLKKHLNLDFGGILEFCLRANFGSFGQIWVEFATLTVAESMPEAKLISLKPSNSSTVNPNATWSVSLESYIHI
jgi:hypothetical protein